MPRTALRGPWQGNVGRENRLLLLQSLCRTGCAHPENRAVKFQESTYYYMLTEKWNSDTARSRGFGSQYVAATLTVTTMTQKMPSPYPWHACSTQTNCEPLKGATPKNCQIFISGKVISIFFFWDRIIVCPSPSVCDAQDWSQGLVHTTWAPGELRREMCQSSSDFNSRHINATAWISDFELHSRALLCCLTHNLRFSVIDASHFHSDGCTFCFCLPRPLLPGYRWVRPVGYWFARKGY